MSDPILHGTFSAPDSNTLIAEINARLSGIEERLALYGDAAVLFTGYAGNLVETYARQPPSQGSYIHRTDTGTVWMYDSIQGAWYDTHIDYTDFTSINVSALNREYVTWRVVGDGTTEVFSFPHSNESIYPYQFSIIDESEDHTVTPERTHFQTNLATVTLRPAPEVGENFTIKAIF